MAVQLPPNNRILVPSTGPNDWRRLLAQPDLHWEQGYSARTLANSWESSGGFPPEIEHLLRAAFGPLELIFAIPEYKTALPGGRRESQSDVFVLARHGSGLVTCTIEGKVNEPFGPTVAEWSLQMSAGKERRLEHVCRLLGIDECPADLHYQLLHRTASAVIEAERFASKHAAMIVHSFSTDRRWFEAFDRFCSLFGSTAEVGVPAITTLPGGVQLLLGWACGDQRFRSV